MNVTYEFVLPGKDAPKPSPGDFILCHRKGFVSALIRLGERLHFRSGSRWSHAAIVEDQDTIIEALTRGVVRNPISNYRDILYVIVRTNMSEEDAAQALAYARSCLGETYGFLTILGVALRFLAPRLDIWNAKICSGLVAQSMTRSWAIFPGNPASLSPAELAEAFAVPPKPES